MTNNICGKCKRPLLERFDGKVFCRKCGESVKKNNLTLNERSDYLFRLSELCYMRYLAPYTGEQIGDRKALLQDAIRLCQESAAMDHPKALFRLGYYHEYYMKEEKSEGERIRRAFDFYLRAADIDGEVEFHQLTDGKYVSENIKDLDEYAMLKKQAALRIVELLSKYPYIFGLSRSVDKNNRYVKIQAKICDRYGIRNELASKKDDSGKSRAEVVYRTLSACYDKKRPPLFGTFLITGAQLHELLALEVDKAAGRKHKIDIICESLCFHYLVVNQHGIPDPKVTKQTEFLRIRQGTPLTTDDVANDASVIFAFFNRSAYRPSYVSKKQAERVYSQLFDEVDNRTLIDLLSSSSQKDHLLFFDDLIWLENIENSTDIADLFEIICREG